MDHSICPECGRVIETSDQALNELKIKAENLLPSAEVRRIRRKLRLTQASAGAILGGGPNAFHKYESGMIVPSQAICSTLCILDEFPEAPARGAQALSFGGRRALAIAGARRYGEYHAPTQPALPAFNRQLRGHQPIGS
jgi:putative zinc finger/helix-turn-helix YgiT family protein